MTTSDISPKLMAGFAVAAVVLVALIVWFALVSPQRSKASSLDRQIADQQVALTAATAPPPTPAANENSANTSVLETALPARLEMPSILRQVQRLASTSSVSLVSFTPSSPVALTGYQAVPIDIFVTGNYGQIRRFMQKLRVHARTTKRGGVKASGRLFSVESIGLNPGVLPQLSANIRVDAFVFSGASAPVPAPAPTITEGATP